MKIRDAKGRFPGRARYLRCGMPFPLSLHRVRGIPGKLQRFVAVVAVSIGLWSSFYPVPVQAASKSGVQLSHAEAVSYFLLNCVYFGKWQDEHDPQNSKVIRIGVLGRDPLGRTLDEVAEKARESWFSGGSILIKRSDDPEKLKDCLVVFVSTSESGNLIEIHDAFKHGPVLLVSEIPGFTQRGGVIEVRISEERLQFDINLDQLAASRIELSSRMKKRASAFIQQGKRIPNTFPEGGGK